MVYKVIGLMSGSSLDGLDLVYTELHENRGKWSFEILAADCYGYDSEWVEKLGNAVSLNALDYQLLHTAYGHYIGEQVNRFIEQHGLQYHVALVASHGHTTFHQPVNKMTAQLGDGAAIAAKTGLAVVSDLRALDVALGGQGAPIVPVGEKLLFDGYSMFLNLGGIANISFNSENGYIAFDVCPANRVLNTIAAKAGKEYDAGGEMAALGILSEDLLQKLNSLSYYEQPYPKSLDNSFGVDEVGPLIRSFGLTNNDSLRTYVEHIVQQVKLSIQNNRQLLSGQKLLVTGGGAFNTFLMERLKDELAHFSIEVILPEEKIVQYKEALIMALIGVLRWREESTTIPSVTGATKASVGGALWMGQEV